MKFICLGYFDKALHARPKAEIEAMLQQCPPQLAELYGTGRVIVEAGLEAPSVTIRTVQGTRHVTDGPFAETDEQLGSCVHHRGQGSRGSDRNRQPATGGADERAVLVGRGGVEIQALHTFAQP